MGKKNFDLIVFDWDGTLMDSTGAIVKSIQAAATDLGLPVPDVKAASYVIGLGLREAMEAVVPGLDPHCYPQMVERYRHHYLIKSCELTLFDGVRDMIDDLSKRGHLLAVATGKSRAGLNRALEETGMMPCFHASRCADETFSKPHPAMLNELTEELGQEMARTVMIGDTTHDLQMAANAGAQGIAVRYGAHPEHELRLHNPIFSASSAPELHAWLIDNA